MAKQIDEARIIVTKQGESTLYAALEGGRLFALRRAGSGISDAPISTGYVENVIANLQAAFVRFQGRQTGFLQFRDVPDNALSNRDFHAGEALKSGDMLPVQLERAAHGRKQARLTAFLSLHGAFSVVTLGKSGIGCSKRLDEEVRVTLIERVRRGIARDARFDKTFLKRFGVILRTEAGEAMSGEDPVPGILDEIYAHAASLSEIKDMSAKRTPGSLLYEQKDGEMCEQHLTTLYHALLSSAKELSAERDVRSLPVTVVTDDQRLHETILATSLVRAHPELKVLLHEGEGGNLLSLYGLDKELDALDAQFVWLKSGAFLVIDDTEAMTVIDVNSGKNIRSRADAVLKINLEAAEEVMRQIRLRGCQGIIMIDFINMRKEEERERLSARLHALCAFDTAHVRFVDFTALGIAELVRSEV